MGRGSSQADQEGMLNKWKADFSGMPVHGEQGALVQSQLFEKH